MEQIINLLNHDLFISLWYSVKQLLKNLYIEHNVIILQMTSILHVFFQITLTVLSLLID